MIITDCGNPSDKPWRLSDAVNTRPSYTSPFGQLRVVRYESKAIDNLKLTFESACVQNGNK